MRAFLAIGRVVLSAAAAYGFVWAFSTPFPMPYFSTPETVATAPAANTPSSDQTLGSLAAAPASSDVRVAPPFDGLTLPDAAFELARRAEPLRLEAERDASGEWVIGYGRRSLEPPADPITARQADAMLREDLARAGEAVRESVRIPLSSNEYGALTEFARSIGPDNFSHTLVAALINAQDRDAAAQAFMLWTTERVDGEPVESPTLVAERERTRALFLGEAASAGS